VKVLFDHGTPAPVRHQLIGHEVAKAYERGWSALQNGDLIAAAEAGEYEVRVTGGLRSLPAVEMTGK